MKRVAWLVWLSLGACGAPKPAVETPDAGAWWDEALGGCIDQRGSEPDTILQMVERINALPHPVSVGCVVAALPRPLTLVATDSVFSAQPASGRRSPRVFILYPKLILSVVLAGAGTQLLEFGELLSAGRTLKGELPFPVSEPVDLQAPFRHVLMGQARTSCALCHRNEQPHPGIEGAFVSGALRPDPGSLVPMAELEPELASCDPTVDRPRCELLVALLGLGPVLQGKFPSGFELFIQ